MCVSISQFYLENGTEPTHFTFKYLFFEIRKKKKHIFILKKNDKTKP